MTVITKTLESVGGQDHTHDEFIVDVTEGSPASATLTGKLAKTAIRELAGVVPGYEDHLAGHHIAVHEDPGNNGHIKVLTADHRPDASVVKINFNA